MSVLDTTPATEFDRLRSRSATAPALLELLWKSCRRDDPPGLVREALALVLPTVAADYAALVRPEHGRWTIEADLGSRRALPSDLLAEALDRDAATGAADWLVAPLVPRDPAEGLLVAHLADAKLSAKTAKNGAAHAPALESLDALAAALAAGLSSARSRYRQRRRIDRLETILTLAAQWDQTLEMEPLLNRMAEAATRLLGADRASIFLWDRPNQTLVGRPALGVAGGELRIPDDAGIVGQVVQTGEPRRVGSSDLRQQQQINRAVDAKLGYQTRSLLCVPLRAADGEMLGAFEVINKLDGDFTGDDEAALVELAAPCRDRAGQHAADRRAARRTAADRRSGRARSAAHRREPARSTPSARRSPASPTPTWPC